MISKLLRKLAMLRASRRASTKLTPKYTANEIRRLKKCRAKFEGVGA